MVGGQPYETNLMVYAWASKKLIDKKNRIKYYNRPFFFLIPLLFGYFFDTGSKSNLPSLSSSLCLGKLGSLWGNWDGFMPCKSQPHAGEHQTTRLFWVSAGGKKSGASFPHGPRVASTQQRSPHRTLNDGTAVRPKTATLEGSVARRPPPPIADCDVDVAISNWPASSAVLPAQKSYTQIYIHCRKNTACVGMLNKEETLK